MNFLAFAASHRSQSYNRKLAKVASGHLISQGHVVNFLEYNSFDLPVYNDENASVSLPAEVHTIGQYFKEADGVIISAPEYNWSYPGSLKTMIDWVSRLSPLPTMHKTAFLMSASTGPRGGIMGLSHLEAPLKSLQMHVHPKMFPLGAVSNAFSEEDTLLNQKQHQSLIRMLDEYIQFTQKLTQN